MVWETSTKLLFLTVQDPMMKILPFISNVLKENKIPNLNFFGTIDPTKILFYLPSQKVYLLKNHCTKRIMLGIIADTKKSMKSFFRNNIKRDSKIIYRVFINTGQDELLNFI